MTVHECAEHKWLSEDNMQCVAIPLAPIATNTSNVVISSPIGCRRALSSSSDSAVAPEPVKRQCCIDENQLTDNQDCRVPSPSSMDDTIDSSKPICTATINTALINVETPTVPQYQEVSFEAIIECSQHTTTTTLPNPESTASYERLCNAEPSFSEDSNQDTNNDNILFSTTCSTSLSTPPPSSSSTSKPQQEEGDPEVEHPRNSTAKSYTVSKEFTIERRNDINLKLEVRSQDGSLVVQRSPLLVRRTDSERQLVC